MLTGSLVRVRYARDKIVPRYANAREPAHLAAAELLIDLFARHEGETRGDLEAELREAFGDDPGQFVARGLMKLLDDRSDFAVVSDHPPEALREAVFVAAARARLAGSFDKQGVLERVGGELGLTVRQIEDGLFADLKSEQRLTRVEPTTPERLLQRYNVALAQAVLLRAVHVRVEVRNESTARLRRLFRLVKFHRLVCDVTQAGPASWRLDLDGPLSLFTATQKYGLQLALFLPALLAHRDFELEAELRWGPAKARKVFNLTPMDGLVSHLPEHGSYVPPEVVMFAEQFRKRVGDWTLSDEAEVYPLGDSFWVPDFRLTHTRSGRSVGLEVLGFWRKSGTAKHLARLRQFAPGPFLLAVSDSLKIDDE
jgi:predicted nuclease of restriction endonuclease-like RecB superfamily